MNNQFEYKGYKFNIKVEFDVKVEKCIGGKRWHRVFLNHMGSANWGVQDNEVEDSSLLGRIEGVKKEAEDWVNKRHNTGYTETQKALLEMGFKA